jgi:superfamily II DNA or RNA helicase
MNKIPLKIHIKNGLMVDIEYPPSIEHKEVMEYILEVNEVNFDPSGNKIFTKVFIADYFNPEKGQIRIPLGLVSWFLKSLNKAKLLDPDLVEMSNTQTDTFDIMNVDFDKYIKMYNQEENKEITLYDHQVDGLKSILKKSMGILSHPTGSGKGEIIIALSRILQEHGQVVVVLPNGSSLTSTIKRFKQYGVPFYDYHKIRNMESPDRIILSTPKVLLNDLKNGAATELVSSIKYLITNEVHHSQAFTWRDLAVGLPNLTRSYGLSATPKLFNAKCIRDMNLQETMIRGSHGDIVSTVRSADIKDLISVPKIINVEFEPLVYNKKSEFSFNWFRIKNYVNKPDRLNFVASIANAIDELTDFTSIVFVSQIIKQGDILYEMYPEKTAAWYGGGIVKNKIGLNLDKKSIFDAIENKEIRHIIITSHGREDINLPTLNVAIMMELSEIGAVKQCVGRVVRKGTPSFFVNVYDKVPKLLNLQAEKRSKVINMEYGAIVMKCWGIEEFEEKIKHLWDQCNPVTPQLRV